MIYTSYYGFRHLNRNRHYLVQVSNSTPPGVTPDFVFHEAIPSWRTIVNPYKEGLLSQEQYTELYLRELAQQYVTGRITAVLKRIIELAGDRDVVLLCYEKPSSFCHRLILGQWIRQHYGYDVAELTGNPDEPTLF